MGQHQSRLGFAWQMFKVVPPKGQAGQTLTEPVNTLGGSLFGDAAKVADEAWHKSFAGKTEVTAKALSPIKSLRHKLAGLSFVEPRVTPLVDLIDGTLAAVPDKGPITGTALVGLQGLVRLLRDPAAMIEHGQRIIEGQSPNAALLGLGPMVRGKHWGCLRLGYRLEEERRIWTCSRRGQRRRLGFKLTGGPVSKVVRRSPNPR